MTPSQLPEIIPPSQTDLVRVWGWDVPVKTFKVVRAVGVAGLVALTGWLIQNFFQLRGIVNVFLSRVDLFFTALSLFAIVWALTLRMWHKRVLRAVSLALLLALALVVDWQSPKPQAPSPRGGLSRSSLAFSREFGFPLGKLWPDDSLAINVYYRNVSPTPVEVLNVFGQTCLEPDASPNSQQLVIRTFQNFIANMKDLADSTARPYMLPFTMQTAEGKYFTTEFCAERAPWIRQRVTQTLLDDLDGGKQILFEIVQIDFKDGGDEDATIHHLRKCAFLLPPAQPHGTWHLCEEGFNHSD